MPKVITHDKGMFDCLRELEMFYAAMAPLKQKALAFLIQLPPSIGFKSGFKVLQNFVGHLTGAIGTPSKCVRTPGSMVTSIVF